VDPLAAISGVATFFEAHAIAWMIGGSLASSVHGDFRATQDVDILAKVTRQHAEPMERELSDSYYLNAAAIREAVETRGCFNLIHLESYMKVDVFVADASAWTAMQFDRIVKKQIGASSSGKTLPFASPEDVVLHKLRWFRLGGEQSTHQLIDVQAVLRVQGSRIDNSYLDSWAPRLAIADLLQRVRASTSKSI
jgi:hypothetical protein